MNIAQFRAELKRTKDNMLLEQVDIFWQLFGSDRIWLSTDFLVKLSAIFSGCLRTLKTRFPKGSGGKTG